MEVITLISGDDSGGVRIHVHSLLQNLSRTIEVTMVCFLGGPFAQEARELGIPTAVLPGCNLLRTYCTLKRTIREGGYQFIYCHGVRGNTMGALLRRSTDLPMVTAIHSDYQLDYLGHPLSRLIYGTINAIALRRLDYRTGVSGTITNLLIKWGFDPDRLFTIYNDIGFTPRAPALGREEYFHSVGLEADEDGVTVGTAARLGPVKNIATLIRGFAKAHQEYLSLRLLIAGDDEQMPMLKGLAAKLEVERQVYLAEWVSDADSLYHTIDINTLTSLSETFPYSLTEEARATLSIIASRVGGIPYLIEYDVHGLLFETGGADTPARHPATLVKGPILRQHLRERPYQWGREDFSLESTLERQLNIYETILRRQSRKKGRRGGALVCGAYDRGNTGGDTILEAIVTGLRQIDPDLPVWVLSHNSDDTHLTYRTNSICAFASPRFLWRVRKTHLYINSGGSLMQDVTSHHSLRFYLFTISWAKRLSSQVMMYGYSTGPTHSPANRRRASRVFQKSVDAITLRDTYSAEESEDMGMTKSQVILSIDLTVIFPVAPTQVVDGVLESQGIDPHGRYTGFALRPQSGFEAEAAVFGAAADYAHETYGLTSVFLPIERRLDMRAARLATQHMKAPHYILFQTSRSDHTIGLFARVQAVVPTRLHALVLSAGQGVPLVDVVYDQRISSFLFYIGQDLYTGLGEVMEEALRAHIDTVCAHIGNEAFLFGDAERLHRVEHRNSETARVLLERWGT